MKIWISISWRQPIYQCMEILQCLTKNRLYTKMLRLHLFSIFIKTPRALPHEDTSLCQNYFHTTGQYDWWFLIFYLSWLIFTCHIIEYRASLWQLNPKILPVADKFCLSLTSDRQGFAWTETLTNLCTLTITNILNVL